MSNKTATGLDEKIDGLIAYVFLFFSGIIYLVIEKENKYVRFHALQSVIFSVAAIVVSIVVGIVLGWIPVIGWLASKIVWLATVAAVAFLAYNAYKGVEFKIPFIGEIVYNQIYRS